MLGAGTVINPIIKIVTTVAILAAVGIFIVKPVLDTTEKAIDSAARQIAGPAAPASQASQDADLTSARSRAQSFAQSLQSTWPAAAREINACVKRRRRRPRDGALRRARPKLVHTVQSDRSFALSYADSLAAQGDGARAERVDAPASRSAGFQPAAMQRCRNLADDLLLCFGRSEPRRDDARAGTVINPIIKIVVTVWRSSRGQSTSSSSSRAARHDREHDRPQLRRVGVRRRASTREEAAEADREEPGDVLRQPAQRRQPGRSHPRPAGARALAGARARPRGCGSRRPSRSRGRSATRTRPSGSSRSIRSKLPSVPPRLSIACTSVASRVAGTTGEPFSSLPWWERMMWSTACASSGSKPSIDSIVRRTR